ncbi:MAG: 2-oxo acid dehydrogenase subunit E2 [Pseudolabrys sp.]
MEDENSNRFRLAWSQLIGLSRSPEPTAEIRRYPPLRNFVADILAEGRRKKIAHITFEADISGIRERLAEYRRQTGEAVSITSYIAKSYACALAENTRMQAYRLGRSRLISFDDVDLAFMVERDADGEPQPVFYIVRAAQKKTAQEIHKELQVAKQVPLGTTGPISALELQFFLLPRFVRRIVWFFIRRNPYWFKSVAGTAGLTSFGMHTSGAAIGLPITPMTLTLTVGAIEKKLALHDGAVVEREVIHMNISMDHDIIDGAPSMRFANRLKEILQLGTALAPAPPAQESKQQRL